MDIAAPASELDRILRDELLEPAYQPIVDLATGQVVAYEALARVKGESPLARPDLLFDAARAHGRLVELDWACRLAAVRGAVDHGLRRSLFINCEPEAMATAPPPGALALFQRAESMFQPILELTERELNDHPRAILETLPVLRERGVALALDDVGVDPRSLALMPFVLPDVIKLDLALTQAPLTADLAETVHAVNAHAERKGALVLAEGIENDHHLLRARALGATHGQGWYFGRPGPLPAEARMPVARLPLPGGKVPGDHGQGTPFEAMAGLLDVREGPKRLLFALSRQLEAHAERLDHAGVLLSTFQTAERYTGDTRRRYTDLAQRLAFVGALGQGLEHHADGNVRGATIEAGDPLMEEWDVCVLGPHFAGAFVARDLGDRGADGDRRFAFATTYDRELVVRIARRLMARVAPVS
ncbi:MAG: EAL domain-containing protein [Solirubrobacteraceae bacterium]|nr:EAL domain-containing protein [Solirubrobacteraceae bacterium]